MAAYLTKRFVASNPHLLASFTGPDGKPVGGYLGGVRKRFGRWILDTAHAAWVKSCLLQVTPWSHPYIREGDF
jgi:hypothetical protein